MVAGEVVQSDVEGYAPGDPMHHDLGYREYALVDPGNRLIDFPKLGSTSRSCGDRGHALRADDGQVRGGVGLRGRKLTTTRSAAGSGLLLTSVRNGRSLNAAATRAG